SDSYEHLTRDNYPRRPDKIVVARPEKIVDVNHGGAGSEHVQTARRLQQRAARESHDETDSIGPAFDL
ncbi:hypothetical protein, partial [Paraburkholderia sp. GAS32]|uniref:hypothetical protein n=1 Tax=Paraburkholderia sp. GAS32 TaxID=3035129 RepID=UPI003D1A25DA